MIRAITLGCKRSSQPATIAATPMMPAILYLDLGAFYESAKALRNFTCYSTHVNGKSVADICDKLTCVIEAIRNDGLDPRWNPERDALVGLLTTLNGQRGGGYCDNVTPAGADQLIRGLHERGYKIVKDAE